MPIQTPSNLFSVALVAVCAACSPAPDPIGPRPGHSDRPRGGPAVPAILTPDAGPSQWERWPEVAAYQVAVPRAPSQHLAADHEAETLANTTAAPYPVLPASAPTGAILLQRLYAPGATTPEILFAMAKGAASTSPDGGLSDGWEYLVLEPGGLVIARGALEACARCHAEAPHDHLFGRAR